MAYYWNKDGNVMDREIRRKESVAFFTNVKHLADKNGLTNKELASVLDIHPTLLWKYLGGNTVPREDTFESAKRHAMDFFDISGTELVDGTFEEDHEEVVTADPVKEEEDRADSFAVDWKETAMRVKEEEDRANSFAADWTETAMRVAINKRRDQIAQLQIEMDALERALALMKADNIL